MPRKDLWTKEDKKIARDLWMQGYSSRYIGDKMGKTRRSIIGLANRLGLIRADRPPNPVPFKQARHNQYTGRKPIKPLGALLGHKRSDGKPVTVKDVPMPKPSEAAAKGYRADGRLLDLMELRGNTCRWPVGDPQINGFGYCGAATDWVCPYCVIHKKIAYHVAGARQSPMYWQRPHGK